MTNWITYGGCTRSRAGWAAHLGINPASFYERLCHWPLERACTAPRSARGPVSQPKPRPRRYLPNSRGEYQCTGCKVFLTAEHYYADPRTRSQLSPRCKPCTRAQKNRWLRQRDDAHRQQRRIYMKNYMRQHSHKYAAQRALWWRKTHPKTHPKESAHEHPAL